MKLISLITAAACLYSTTAMSINMADAVKEAVNNDPYLKKGAHEVEARKEEELSSLRELLPRVDIIYHDGMELDITTPIYDPEIFASRKISSARTRVQRLSNEELADRVAYNIKNEFIKVLEARSRIKVDEEYLEEWESLDYHPEDKQSVETFIKEVRNKILEQRKNLRQTVKRLLFHIYREERYDEPIEGELKLVSCPEDTILRIGVEERTRRIRAEAAELEARIRMRTAIVYPTIGARTKIRNNNTLNELVMTIPLNSPDYNRISAEKIRLEGLEEFIKDYKKEVRFQITEALTTLKDAEELIPPTEQIVAANQRRYEEFKDKYLSGGVGGPSITDLEQALNSYRNAKLQLTRRLAELERQFNYLELVLGLSFEGLNREP